MANVCTFSMRIRGAVSNIQEMLKKPLPVYEANITHDEGTNSDAMLQLDGECRWSVHNSWFNEAEVPIPKLTKQLKLEIEVFGYDRSEPCWLEHYHYACGQCIKESLPEQLDEESYEELDEDKKALYDRVDGDYTYYALQSQYVEPYDWDEKKEEMRLNFDMDYAQLGHMKELSGLQRKELDEDNSFIEAGDIFAIRRIPGLVYQFFPQDAYEEGDPILTVFSGLGGKKPERDCFGNIIDGMNLSLTKSIEETEESIRAAFENQKKAKESNDFAVFRDEAEFISYAFTEKMQIGYARAYFIVTRRAAICGGIAVPDSPAAFDPYDRLFSTIRPVGKTSDREETMQEKEDDEKKAVIREMDRIKYLIRTKIEQADKVLEVQTRIDKSLESIRTSSESNMAAAKDMADRAAGKLKEIQDKIRQEEQTMSSLGLFAMSKKNECRQRIEQLKGTIRAAEIEAKKAENVLNQMKEKLNNQIKAAKSQMTHEFDFGQWKAYSDKLKEISSLVGEQKKQMENGGTKDDDWKEWKAPSLPEEPPIREKEMDSETLALIVEEILRYSGPMTLDDIKQRDERLNNVSVQRIGAAIRSMGIKVEKTTEGIRSYYTIRSGY